MKNEERIMHNIMLNELIRKNLATIEVNNGKD